MSVTRDTHKTWAAGYVEQARADLRAAEALQGRHPSVLAMLLQMVFEKLAKAALLYGKRINVEKAQRSHVAALILMGIFREFPQFLDVFPGKAQRQWLPTVKLIEELTRLHPQIARGGPHLEYPWAEVDGARGACSRPATASGEPVGGAAGAV